jgi:hypothetical protein
MSEAAANGASATGGEPPHSFEALTGNLAAPPSPVDLIQPKRPCDSHSRLWRLVLVAVGMCALELIWCFLAQLRDHELSSLHKSAGSSGLISITNNVPHNFWAFLGISTGILIIGVLLSAWAHDPLADRWSAVQAQRERAETDYNAAATLQAARRGELEGLLTQEAVSPQRLATLQRQNHWLARQKIATRAREEYPLNGYWSEGSSDGPSGPAIGDRRPLAGLKRIHGPLTSPDALTSPAQSPSPTAHEDSADPPDPDPTATEGDAQE